MWPLNTTGICLSKKNEIKRSRAYCNLQKRCRITDIQCILLFISKIQASFIQIINWAYSFANKSRRGFALFKTISRNIGMLTKMKHYVPGYILYSLYCTLVLPYINYSILIWGNTCKTYLDKIFKLQKWAIRTILLQHNRSHTGPLFEKYNVLNVFDSFKLELGVFMYKHQTNLLPQTFSNYFMKHNQIHKYPTRECRRLQYSQSQKNVFRSIYTNNWTNFMEYIRCQN